MPIHAFRCACGKQADVLLRGGGRDPATCDEIPAFQCWGGADGQPGALTRMVSAAHVGSAAAAGARPREVVEGGGCEHCATPEACGIGET
jgi:hypothetical protein